MEKNQQYEIEILHPKIITINRQIINEKSPFLGLNTNKIVVYTCITGNYDHLYEPLYRSDDFDYVCFTDNQELESDFWKISKFSVGDYDPTRQARWVKILPHLFLKNYQYSIWVDANIRIIGDLKELIREHLVKASLAFYRHSDGRKCIYEEAKVCIKRNKDNEEVINRQIDRYKSLCYPKNNGLISSGVIIRKHKDPTIIETMEDWWKEVENHSKRDQLSFNFVAWKNGTKFAIIDDYIRDNSYFKWRIHDRELKKK
jgi:hypothetical protein